METFTCCESWIWFTKMQTNNFDENAFYIQGYYVSTMLGL